MSDNQVHIEIDGISLRAARGASLIDVADKAGIPIPRFCYHEKLSVAANCRMCLVQVDKVPKPLPACTLPVAEGMKVQTRSPMVLAAQKAVMRFLLINHPLDCPICDKGGECELQDVAMDVGEGTSRFREDKRVVGDKDFGPLINAEMARCIHCTRCLRFGREIAGQWELGAIGRGENTAIGTFVERPLESELSGNLIDICPVGALTSKPARYRARAWEMRETDAIAPHDCVGSNLLVHSKGDRILRVAPKENAAVNEVWISDRDRFGHQGLGHEERLLSPMRKQDGDWRTVDWESALAATVDGLRKVVADHGASAIGALGSPSATLEELYLLQKVLRGMGCHNVDHRLRQQDFRDQKQAPLHPELGCSLAELEKVDTVLLIGSNCRKEQPLVNHRLRQATRRGARILAVNPIDYTFNYPLAARLIASPAGMVRHVAGIARALGAGTDGELALHLAKVPPQDDEKHLAGYLKNGGNIAILMGSFATAHPDAAIIRTLAREIAEQTGAVLGTLTEGANASGAWIAGAVPHREAAGFVSQTPGLNAGTMIAHGREAYVLLGVEPEWDAADSHAARAALDNASFVVSLTAYRTETMDRYADILLPIALFGENSGTFVNLEGRWQDFVASVNPPGDARPAWRTLKILGNLLGLSGFEYRNHGEISVALKERLSTTSSPPAKPTNGFATPWSPDSLGDAEEKDGLTRIGDVPIHGVDPLVRRAESLQSTSDATDCGLRVNATLANTLRIENGSRVLVAQDKARKVLPATIDDRVPAGCVWLPAGIPASIGLGPSIGPISLTLAE